MRVVEIVAVVWVALNLAIIGSWIVVLGIFWRLAHALTALEEA